MAGVIEKVTDPVGMPVAGGFDETVARKETASPVSVGLDPEAEVTDVVVAPLWITLDRFPVLGIQLPVGVYIAVTA